MTFPLSAHPFPDAAAPRPVLGLEQRMILGTMVRRPGKVLSPAELCAGLPAATARNPRRLGVLIDGLRQVLGHDSIVDVPRRGWMYMPATG